VLPETLMVTQLVKKIPAFNGTWRFNIMLVITNLYLMDIPGFRVRAGARDFIFSKITRLVLGPPPWRLFNVCRGSFPGVQRPEHDVDQTLPRIGEIKNGWTYTSTPKYAFPAWIRTTL
jgi:hypothetical protein